MGMSFFYYFFMKKNILILSLVFIVFSIIFYGKTGNMLIDFSRESYIPYQMLNGEILSKDIFLIYGFFGYFVNFILYKISLNINILLFESLIISYFVSILFYLTLRKFTTEIVSLVFSVLFVTVSIFSNSTFSFAVPYSYSTLWGVLSVYLILFSILYDKNRLAWLSLSLCMVSKVEFSILSGVFIVGYLIYQKKFNVKDFLFVLIFPLISICYFVFSHVNFHDVVQNISYLKTMVKTPSITYLYKASGAFWNTKFIIYSLIKFIPYFIVSLISYFIYKKSRIISLIVLFLGLSLFDIIPIYNLLVFVALIITLINIKKLQKEDIILLFFAIVLSLKSVFAISSYTYANFGFCLMLFYVYYELSKVANKNWLLSHIIIVLIVFNIVNIKFYLRNPKSPIKTDVGTIWLNQNDALLFEDINSYFKDNLKIEDDILIVPEGQILNLIHKKPWKYYNSTFTPLDFETFGEKELIQKVKENSPKYILLYPRNAVDYGQAVFCQNYGIDFCSYIRDNYSKDKIFEHEQIAVIYKKNEK